jgi:large conductance mechanosensitive channel
VVKALTDNILSPIIGFFTRQDFSSLVLTIGPGDWNITLQYGAFLTALINFVITAFVIFLLVRGMNRLANLGKPEEKPKEPDTKKCPYCCTSIPARATRCPSCTAGLPPPVAGEAGPAAGSVPPGGLPGG